MLKPRLPVARPLAFSLWLGSIAAVGIWGCQGPDTFLRSGGGTGTGGLRSGVGGTIRRWRPRSGSAARSGPAARARRTAGESGPAARPRGADRHRRNHRHRRRARRRRRRTRHRRPDRHRRHDRRRRRQPGRRRRSAPVLRGLCSPATSFSRPAKLMALPASVSADRLLRDPLADSGAAAAATARANRLDQRNRREHQRRRPNPTRSRPIRGGYCIQISAGAGRRRRLDFASFYTYCPSKLGRAWLGAFPI